jgi:hypothetical protein
LFINAVSGRYTAFKRDVGMKLFALLRPHMPCD